MFRDLAYQGRVLTALDAHLDALTVTKAKADKVAALAAADPDLGIEVPDYAKQAWDTLKANGILPPSRAGIDYSPRHDGTGRPVPNAVLKVPTGGGKTYLAVAGVSRILNRYLGRNTGFVLWIVPNEAIYTQTLKNLKDRQHPYRQALDVAAANRVKVLEKGDRLDRRDVDANLCVMLLMLQSSNRQDQATLKMFKDRGDVHGFFPPEGNQSAHKAALEATPNLDAYDGLWPMVKDSLGNALRVLRPVVVMDEGHRAVSDLAYRTLYGFNPCYVLELTATPQDVKARGGANPQGARYANLLVEVTGRELDREGMIKMPLNLDPRQGTDWKATLNASLDTLNRLQSEADRLRAETDRYIRPIMLIQVERTGADQRSSGHIHAEDVREWLLSAGFDAAEIAVKTAEQNDLNAPENQDLLAPTNRIRAIITKQALQEGWDCPFAYVLCSLAANSNLKAMTQLIGRILRQPGATKTGIDALDECHIVTHHATTRDVVAAIRDGLERDGLGDLVLQVSTDDTSGTGKVSRRVDRRDTFKSQAIYLPRVLWVDGGTARPLDYETDILAALDWRGFDPTPIADRVPDNPQAAESQLQRITLSDADGELVDNRPVAESTEVMAFDPAYAVRMISDVVINPFVGREVVSKLLISLESRGFDQAKMGKFSGLIVEILRDGLIAARDEKAEAFFRAEVHAGRIQFRLRADGNNWKMPDTILTTEPVGARQLMSNAGTALQKSLFVPIYEADLNSDEQAVAAYLDGEDALVWWHRNEARSQYGLQGWRKNQVYPDFVFSICKADDADKASGTTGRVTALETKGDQLAGNLDTEYKRKLLAFLSKHFAWDGTAPSGQFTLVPNTGETVDAALVQIKDWKVELPKLLASPD
ncbi:DEAD/DEAH box helicase family protein [Jannaschia sp. Os4]|uniref:DEAD/DEAH box helicase n=1 Tax=Jannaschia sp. Os4 TaxID=2807617 RepID=UPI00193A2A52|nr:DEAD/DEAH box helicase family protein [Jannaschia sp. Os4]MBM2576388.1 DEAD/DEAH box helicase family protein [Jannaschia sp. Os4]